MERHEKQAKQTNSCMNNTFFDLRMTIQNCRAALGHPFLVQAFDDEGIVTFLTNYFRKYMKFMSNSDENAEYFGSVRAYLRAM